MLDYLNSLIESINAAQIASLITTMVIAFAAVGAFVFNGINNLKLERSNRLSAERERVDRALEFIERFDDKRYMRLLSRKYRDYPKTITEVDAKGKLDRNTNFLSTFTEAEDEINYFLFFLDTVAILYHKEKLDEEIFKAKLEDYFLSFYHNFKPEISKIVEDIKLSDKTFYYYKNYLLLVGELLELKIRISPREKEKILVQEIKDCRKLLQKD